MKNVIKNKNINVVTAKDEFAVYENCSINVERGFYYGADHVELRSSILHTETPFRVSELCFEKSSAHLSFKEAGRKAYPLSDLIVSDSSLFLTSEVGIEIEEVSGYRSLDIYVSGDSDAYLDFRRFNLDRIYLNLKNLSDRAKVLIIVKDGTKLWVNTNGRVGAYQLRIEGLPKMEVTSF